MKVCCLGNKASFQQRLWTCFVVLCLYIAVHNGMSLMSGMWRYLGEAMKGPTPPPIYHHHQPAPHCLMTIFTTFRPSPVKKRIHMNTLYNWAQYKQRLHLIYYHKNESTSEGMELRKLAQNLGWELQLAPVIVNDIPVLRHMFLHAQNTSDTPYYGYANGDILFTHSLIDTVQALFDYQFKQVLMVGQRTNVNVKPEINLTLSASVEEAAQNRSLFSTNAQDYFFTTRLGYPWHNIPDFVVGRIGYDNWLIVTAIVKDIPVVDLTKTLLAVHQTDLFGNFQGHSNKTKEDVYTNYRMVKQGFSYGLGHTKCSQFYTVLRNGSVVLTPRKQTACKWLYYNQKKNPIFFRDSIKEYEPTTPQYNSTHSFN